MAKLTSIPPLFVTDGLRDYGAAITKAYAVSPPVFASEVLRENFSYRTAAYSSPAVLPEVRHLRVIKSMGQEEKNASVFPRLEAMQGGQQISIKKLADQIPGLTRHTNYVERRNFTQRRRNASLQRKTSSVPQEDVDLQAQVTLERFVYNFCRSHRSLRELDPNGVRKWRLVTPAMKLAVTDHIWTLKEALSFSVSKGPRTSQSSSPELKDSLTKPTLVVLKLKDCLDVKILQTLSKPRERSLSRSELCKKVDAPRTTIYDRLKILQAKALVKEDLFRSGRPGRPKTLYSSAWAHHSFPARGNKDRCVLVS
jgi:predicted transcriptional regulator